MPTPASVSARIRREGQPVILTRDGSDPLDVIAFVRGFKPDELAGGIEQGDREVRMTDDEIIAAIWPGPPARDDRVQIDGASTTVLDCETVRLRGVVAMHVLHVRG